MTARPAVACPTCRTPVEWTTASRWRPFCSERCKLIDAGAWASEAYRMPLADDADPADAGDDPDPREG
ncbi:MAG: DNA gyrase inhibitor YacG [Betaproteobacteria bacterium]